jgi:hypothetical protein
LRGANSGWFLQFGPPSFRSSSNPPTYFGIVVDTTCAEREERQGNHSSNVVVRPSRSFASRTMQKSQPCHRYRLMAGLRSVSRWSYPLRAKCSVAADAALRVDRSPKLKSSVWLLDSGARRPRCAIPARVHLWRRTHFSPTTNQTNLPTPSVANDAGSYER